jgi:hypothetical protein
LFFWIFNRLSRHKISINGMFVSILILLDIDFRDH